MAIQFEINDPVTGFSAAVNANEELQVALAALSINAGFAKLATDTGEEVSFTEHGQLAVAQEALVFWEQVDGTAIDIRKWQQNVTTMTIAQASGFQTLNASAITTINTVAQLTSVKSFPFFGELRFKFDVSAKTTVGPQANATIELGIGTASGTAAPTDGAMFRWANDATFRCVISFGGTEIISGPLTAPTINDVHDFDITVDNDDVKFFVDTVEVAELVVPSNIPYPFSTARLPVYVRTYTGGVAPAAAPVISTGRWTMTQDVAGVNRDWDDTQAMVGGISHQSPVTPFAQTSNHANSTSPTSATLSNTAAGYTTLGGRWQFAAPAGAATDFALFGYQVPTGFQLFVSGVRISAINTGAAVATTATILDWFLGINSSAVSLATADAGGNVWGPRRIPIGIRGWVVGAAIGAAVDDIWVDFYTALVIESARFFHIGVQVPVGTATASQVIRGDAFVNGYFE